MNYILICALLFFSFPVYANSEKEVVDKIKSNVFIPHKAKKSKKQALISFYINDNGKADNISIDKNGVSEEVINQCILGITKSEPFDQKDINITFLCENKKEKLAKDFKKASRKYMKKVQKKIKANWYPIKSKNSYQIGVKFDLSKNGQASNIEVVQSSGNENNDITAIKAIELSNPFDSIPEILLDGEDSVDIEYTFDYNTRQKSNALGMVNLGLNLIDLMD